MPVALVNDRLGFGVEVTTRKDQLPCLYEWQNFQAGQLCVGIEPSTHHVLGNNAARERGEMIWLDAGEERPYFLLIRVLHGRGRDRCRDPSHCRGRRAAIRRLSRPLGPLPAPRRTCEARRRSCPQDRRQTRGYTMSMTDSLVPRRDYSLTGPESRRAVEIGLASAEWYHSEVPRKVMKELMQRRDGPAIRDTLIWLGLLVVGRGGGIALLGHLVVRAVLHRLRRALWLGLRLALARMRPRHRLPTAWMNDVVYQIASFMMMRNPVTWRWSHARHHTDTIIVGRDPEIGFMRPPRSC